MALTKTLISFSARSRPKAWFAALWGNPQNARLLKTPHITELLLHCPGWPHAPLPQRSPPGTHPPPCCRVALKQVEKRQWLRVSRGKKNKINPPLPGYLLERGSRATGRPPAPGGMLVHNPEENMTPLLPVLIIHQERLMNPSQCLETSLKPPGGFLAIWGMLFLFWFPPSCPQAS